jgi:hypothetical protein
MHMCTSRLRSSENERFCARWIPCHDCDMHVVSTAEHLGSLVCPITSMGGALKAG